MVVCGFMFWRGKWISLIAGVNNPQNKADENQRKRAVRYVSVMIAAMGAAIIIAMMLEIARKTGFPGAEQVLSVLIPLLFSLLTISAFVGLFLINRKR